MSPLSGAAASALCRDECLGKIAKRTGFARRFGLSKKSTSIAGTHRLRSRAAPHGSSHNHCLHSELAACTPTRAVLQTQDCSPAAMQKNSP